MGIVLGDALKSGPITCIIYATNNSVTYGVFEISSYQTLTFFKLEDKKKKKIFKVNWLNSNVAKVASLEIAFISLWNGYTWRFNKFLSSNRLEENSGLKLMDALFFLSKDKYLSIDEFLENNRMFVV